MNAGTPDDHHRFARVNDLFRAAQALPPQERDAFLAEREREGEDSQTIRQVRGMLRADDQSTGVLDRPVFGAALTPAQFGAASDDDGGPRAAMPDRIGLYRIHRVIGEGGMGIVYEAEQENPRRRVALKVLRTAARSRNMLGRFEREAQILGRLDHPGIAQILEAGVDDTGDGAAVLHRDGTRSRSAAA